MKAYQEVLLFYLTEKCTADKRLNSEKGRNTEEKGEWQGDLSGKCESEFVTYLTKLAEWKSIL